MSGVCKALIGGIVLGLTAVVLLAADAEPTREQIAQWVEELGDNDFTVRDKASQMLWKAGRAAEGPLRKAADSDDVEVRRRARDILEKFKWGIYPDTPAGVVDLIQKYKGGDPDGKQRAVQELFALGSKGCAALVKIARAEDDDNIRQALFLQLSQDAARAVPGLLAEGNYAILDELLELSMTLRPDDRIVQNFAAYALLRGKLDERIVLTNLNLSVRDNADSWTALAFLYRAKGDLPEAAKAAEKADRGDLVEAILAEAGDWKALSDRAEKQEGFGDFESMGLRAAYHRLAGNTLALDKVVVELRRLADEHPEKEFSWLPTKALLINAGPGEALDRLARGDMAALGFDILVTQMKIPEALAYADKVAAGAERESAIRVRLAQARMFQVLGEADKARELFALYGKQFEEKPGSPWAEDLVRNEFRAGLKEQALEHAGLLLDTFRTPDGGPDGNQQRVIGIFVPLKKDEAYVLWQLLDLGNHNTNWHERLKRFEAILAGKVEARELAPLLDEWARRARKLTPPLAESWLTVLGELALSGGLEQEGRTYLDQALQVAVTPRASLKLGDHFAAKKEWRRAAEAYGKAQEKDPKQPLPVWLKGWALAQGGDAKEGQKIMELAHWLPLGDEAVRSAFGKELVKRPGKEAKEALEREVELTLKTGKPGAYYTGEALRLAAGLAFERKEYLKAADLQEKALLRVMTPNTEFVEHSAYVNVPHSIHSLRARGLAAAGRLADARREIEYCQSLLPGNVDLPIHVVPDLEKRGDKKVADETFAKALEANEKICRDYPGSATHHNNLAWMCACCRRELDKGLEHAMQAVKLSTDNAGYLDTLAEVHFQRGDKDKAVELMKKCLDLDGGRGYYRKQLQRFEAGDRTADIPSVNDDN